MTDENDTEAEEEQTEPSPLDDPEWLEEQYTSGGEDGEGLTQAEIGEHPDVVDHHDGPVTSSTVSHYMKKHEIATQANVVDDERLDDEEWLREAYLGEEEGGEGEAMTMQDIADEIGCSDGTVMRRLHQFEIPVRRSTVGEAEDGEGDEEEDDEEAEEAEA